VEEKKDGESLLKQVEEEKKDGGPPKSAKDEE